MPPFRTVAGARAGTAALGILVPPGARTLIVVRPRALRFDLVVVVRETGTETFLETDRVQAGLAAQQLSRVLMAGDTPPRLEAIETQGGYWVRVQLARWAMLACPREPGQAYRPTVFSTLAEAQEQADLLRDALCPPPDAERELYTNLSQFGRPSTAGS